MTRVEKYYGKLSYIARYDENAGARSIDMNLTHKQEYKTLQEVMQKLEKQITNDKKINVYDEHTQHKEKMLKLAIERVKEMQRLDKEFFELITI